jgi:hypothetical protein
LRIAILNYYDNVNTKQELGAGIDLPVKDPVRHFIDFSGVQGQVNIPKELVLFNDFIWNETKRRISFRAANNTSFVTYGTAKIYTDDKSKHEFNRIFTEANQNLKYSENPGDNAVWTHDAIDFNSASKEQSDSYLNILHSNKHKFLNILDKAGNTVSNAPEILTYALLAYGGIKIYEISQINQRRKTT